MVKATTVHLDQEKSSNWGLIIYNSKFYFQSMAFSVATPFSALLFHWSMFWINILWAATNSDDGNAHFLFLWPLTRAKSKLRNCYVEQDFVLSHIFKYKWIKTVKLLPMQFLLNSLYYRSWLGYSLGPPLWWSQNHEARSVLRAVGYKECSKCTLWAPPRRHF